MSTPMETLVPVYRASCEECGLPALTFDRDGVPYCRLHAVEFIPAPGDIEPEEADELEDE